jgi:transcriptional regulator with XRE-family HTH domain
MALAGRTQPTAKITPVVPVPNRLRELREARGMTRAELAERVGVAEGTIVRWELRTYGIPDHRKAVLARVLDTDVATVMADWPEVEPE